MGLVSSYVGINEVYVMKKNYQNLSLLSLLFTLNSNIYAQDHSTLAAHNVYNISAHIGSKLLPEDDKRPQLENYANYNDFLHAMYVYNKTQEDQTKPRIIVNLPTLPINQPEYSLVENDSDVTTGGESIPATVDNH